MAIALGIYYVSCRYLLYLIMPFAIAMFITLVLKGAVDWLSEKLHVPRRGMAFIMVFLAYAVIATLLTFGTIRLIWAASNWFTRLPALYTTEIVPAVRSVFNWYEARVATIDPQFQAYAEQLASQIISKSYDLVSALSRGVLSFAQSLVAGIPGTFIGLMFGFISTFFMEMDYPQIRHFILAQFNEGNQNVVHGVKHFMKYTIGRMVFSYLILMAITFVELIIGLRIIGVDNFIIVALLIAFTDILPALGTGTVVLPWTVIELIRGDFSMAVKLFIMYLIITVIRNILEPKIVGDTTGTNPALMLISMYLGAKVLGPLGFLILPVTIIIVKKLNDEGLIHLYKSDYLPRIKRQRKPKRSAKASAAAEDAVQTEIQQTQENTAS